MLLRIKLGARKEAKGKQENPARVTERQRLQNIGVISKNLQEGRKSHTNTLDFLRFG